MVMAVIPFEKSLNSPTMQEINDQLAEKVFGKISLPIRLIIL
jgi:hypothetical protein